VFQDVTSSEDRDHLGESFFLLPRQAFSRRFFASIASLKAVLVKENVPTILNRDVFFFSFAISSPLFPLTFDYCE